MPRERTPFALRCPQTKQGRKEKTMYKNNVELIGFLGKDAQVRTANTNDNEFTVLSIATQESWKDKETGEWQKATEWHSVICNNALGKYAAGLAKGAHVLIEGVLRNRTYTLQTGSGKKREEKQIRSWFVKANSIVKLDRPGKDAPTDSAPSEADPAETYEGDF
jgi:single-strand DNA-binding protein